MPRSEVGHYFPWRCLRKALENCFDPCRPVVAFLHAWTSVQARKDCTASMDMSLPYASTCKYVYLPLHLYTICMVEVRSPYAKKVINEHAGKHGKTCSQSWDSEPGNQWIYWNPNPQNSLFVGSWTLAFATKAEFPEGRSVWASAVELLRRLKHPEWSPGVWGPHGWKCHPGEDNKREWVSLVYHYFPMPSRLSSLNHLAANRHTKATA